jgi:hypothetical protein
MKPNDGDNLLVDSAGNEGENSALKGNRCERENGELGIGFGASVGGGQAPHNK